MLPCQTHQRIVNSSGDLHHKNSLHNFRQLHQQFLVFQPLLIAYIVLGRDSMSLVRFEHPKSLSSWVSWTLPIRTPLPPFSPLLPLGNNLIQGNGYKRIIEGWHFQSPVLLDSAWFHAGWGPSIVGEKFPGFNSNTKPKPKPNDNKKLASVLRGVGLSHGLALINIAF